VLVTAAVKGEGVSELVTALDRHHEWLVTSGELEQRRRRRVLERTREVVERATRRWLWEETRAEQLINDRLDEVAGGRLSPYELATEILEELRQGECI
jgi:LAO/AO transport system kinase